MQYFNHILTTALKYVEIFIKTKSTQYLFYKKAIQIVCHTASLDHTSQMFCQLDILKIYDLINYMYLYVQSFFKLVPLTLQNKFSMSSRKNIKTIFILCLQEQETRKQFTITIKGALLWNSLHNFIKLSSSLRIFNINPPKKFLGKY